MELDDRVPPSAIWGRGQVSYKNSEGAKIAAATSPFLPCSCGWVFLFLWEGGLVAKHGARGWKCTQVKLKIFGPSHLEPGALTSPPLCPPFPNLNVKFTQRKGVWCIDTKGVGVTSGTGAPHHPAKKCLGTTSPRHVTSRATKPRTVQVQPQQV